MCCCLATTLRPWESTAGDVYTYCLFFTFYILYVLFMRDRNLSTGFTDFALYSLPSGTAKDAMNTCVWGCVDRAESFISSYYEPLHSELKVLPAWCQDRHAIVRWCFCDGWKAMQLFVYIRANWLYAKCSPLKPVSTSGTVEGMLLARGARSHTGIPTCSLEVTAGQTQTNWFD